LLQRSRQLGEKTRARLEQFKERFPAIGDVRGLGYMLAMEFVKEDGRTPDVKSVERVVEVARELGLILLSTGTYSNVVRLLPPINLSDDELEEGRGIIEKALEQVLGGAPTAGQERVPEAVA